MNYYGSIFEDYLDFVLLIDKVGFEIMFDFEVVYNFIEEFMVIVGVKNVFDEYFDENNIDVGGIIYV